MGKQLVARERELAELVTTVADGHGAVLSGVAGVGKTALAAEVARHVEGFGVRVERMVATDASRSISFGALAPVLPPDIIPLHPALVLAAIRRRQDELGGTAPPLFVVDDAHLLDDYSAATVLGLVSTGAVRVVATVHRASPRPTPCTPCGRTASSPTARSPRSIARRRSGFLGATLGGEVASARPACCGSTPGGTRST